jgi:O-antigen ligase
MAFSIVSGGASRTIALTVSAILLLTPVVLAVARSHVRPGFIAIEAPMLLLLGGQLVLRIRAAEDLASDPLDPAGAYRVICVGLALILAALALTDPSAAAVPRRITTRPFRLYALYVFVVFLGAPLSINPLLTAYRGVELVAGLLIVAGAYRVAGDHGLRRLQAVLYWWIVVLIASAWVGLVIFGGEGLSRLDSPFPWQLHGVFPAISSNGLGVLGAILGFWSICRLISRHEDLPARPVITSALAGVGFVTLLFAQYRTGYVAVAIAVFGLLALRSKVTFAWAVGAAVVVMFIWGNLLIDSFEPTVLRGQSRDRAFELSGRLFFWEEAIAVWEESPMLGRGLLTGTRFEVLAPIGRSETSTIHGTWVEVLVGTGIIGTAVLAAFTLMLLARAIREAVRPDGRLAPAVIVILILVRSVTGSSVEVFGLFAMLAIVLSMVLRTGAELRSLETRAATATRSTSM